MQRVCFLLNVHPERIEEYKLRHREVWPEMQRALCECGWRNYSIFLRPDGLLVGYLETTDFHKAVAEMQHREVNKLWQAEMASFFMTDKNPDQAMFALEEIFHLDCYDKSKGIS